MHNSRLVNAYFGIVWNEHREAYPIIVKQNSSIQPWKPIRRASLIGGVAAAEAAMLIVTATGGMPFLAETLLGGVSITGAAIVALVAYFVSQRRGNSLSNLEHDLAKAASIFEQGLINEAEYDRVKGQSLERYHHTRGSQISVLDAAEWGALLGLLVPIILVLSTPNAALYLLVSLVAGAAGAAVSGSSTAVMVYAQYKMVEYQLGAGNHPLHDASSGPRV